MHSPWLVTLFLTVIICDFTAVSTVLSGAELLHVLQTADNYKPKRCTGWDRGAANVYAIWNLFGTEYNIYCGTWRGTYIKVNLKRAYSFEEATITLQPDRSSYYGYRYALHAVNLRDPILSPLGRYDLRKSELDNQVGTLYDNEPYISSQLIHPKTVKPILDSIALLITDFCSSGDSGEIRLGIAREHLVIPLVIPGCSSGRVEFTDERTRLIRGDILFYFWSTKELFGEHSNLENRVIEQIKFIDVNKLPVRRPHVLNVLLPLGIFKEDLQELWEELNGWNPGRRWFGKSEEVLKGTIGYDNDFFLEVEKSSQRDLLRIRSIFQVQDNWNQFTLPAFSSDVFFGGGNFFGDEASLERREPDRFFMKGVLESAHVQTSSFGKMVQLITGRVTSRERCFVQYVSFDTLRELLTKTDVIGKVMEQKGLKCDTVKVRFIFGDHAIPATYSVGAAFGFRDLQVLRGHWSGYSQRAFRSKYKFVCFSNEFLSEDGDLNDAFAVRMEPLRRLPKLTDSDVERPDIGVRDWKLEVIIPKNEV